MWHRQLTGGPLLVKENQGRNLGCEMTKLGRNLTVSGGRTHGSRMRVDILYFLRRDYPWLIFSTEEPCALDQRGSQTNSAPPFSLFRTRAMEVCMHGTQHAMCAPPLLPSHTRASGAQLDTTCVPLQVVRIGVTQPGVVEEVWRERFVWF